jgi:thioredoxin reductase
MTSCSGRAERISGDSGLVECNADVLVLGGGPAGIWAAISAAERGADSESILRAREAQVTT